PQGRRPGQSHPADQVRQHPRRPVAVGRQVSAPGAIQGEPAQAGRERSEGRGAVGGSRAFPNRLPTDWWRRNRRYLMYIVREFTAVPIAIWMVWFLIEIARVRGGPAGYRPHQSPAFVVFSVVCFAFALWH